MADRPTCCIESCLPPHSLWCPDADPTLIAETIRDALAGRWIRTYPTGTVLETVGPVRVLVQVDRN